MYEIAIVFQTISLIYCAVGTFFLFSRFSKTVSKNLLASSLFGIIFGIGYLMEMMASNDGEAFYALITQYIGLALVAFFFALYATELYHFVKIPKFVWTILFCFNFLTFIGVLTSKHHNFYYKDMVYVETGMYPHLECGHTLWFYFFMGAMLATMIYSAVLFTIALFKSQKKFSNVLALVAIAGGILFMLISFSVGFNGYEPISAIINIIIGSTAFVKMGSRSQKTIGMAYIESYMNSPIGMVIVSADNKFIECNNKAKEFYPPFEKYQPGQTVKLEGRGIIHNGEEHKLYVREKCYAVEYQNLGDGGQIITLTDVSSIEAGRTRDDLTGLLNRQAFFDKFSGILAGDPARVDVLIADLNSLKNINDSCGHGEGDNAIKVIADCLKRSFNEKSFVFRFGGDEFVVVSSASEKMFERMTERFAKMVEDANEGRPYKISISYGTSYATNSEGFDIDSLMQKADGDMYQNKKRYYETNHIERRRSTDR